MSFLICLFHQFSDGESETDNDDSIIPSSSLWTQVHTIHYRQMNSNVGPVSAMSNAIGGANAAAASSSWSSRFLSSTTTTQSNKSSSKKNSRTSKRSSASSVVDELWINGHCPDIKSLLKLSLNESIASILTINDLSLNAISLLHILNALNLYWSDLYIETSTIFNHLTSSLTFVPKNDLISLKLTSKVNRQLQDPVVLMMGQLPSWIPEMGYKCSFLFPFETRQLIFYTHAFDRERATQRLIETSSVLSQQSQQHHQQQSDLIDRQNSGPRIERKKVQLSRANILAEMEKILENWSSKQFLEVQYEDEVND